MAISAASAALATPEFWNIQVDRCSSSGTINVGDWLVYSGSALCPAYAGGTAYWKASAAGIALESQPTYDNWGRSVSNTALLFARQGVFRVSANFSGNSPLGVGVYPDATGSGLAAPTGATGVAATWQTGAKVFMSGATSVGGSGVAMLIHWYNTGPAGTGQMDILLTPPRPDYY